MGGSLPWVVQICGLYLFQELQGFVCVQGDAGSLLDRTFEFPFRLQPKLLFSIVSYGKTSQRFQVVEERFGTLKKTTSSD